MTWSGEIAGVPMEQVRMGRGGRMITIDQDVGGIVQQLKEIDPRFCVRWSEKGSYFAVYTREEWEPEGTGYLVGTYQELDGRVVKDIQETVHKWNQPGFSFADEQDRLEDEKRAQADYEFSQKIGESAERLAHALRKDLGYDKSKVFIK